MLLGSSWEGGRCPHRDRAVVYLLATYGVRRAQVSALQLTDIDWREKTIDFAAHKGGKAVRHILTQAVAEALACYLRHERPASDCAYIFLRQNSPHLQLGPLAISSLMRARMVRCGLPPRGPHALRHAFATRLLRAGQPIKSIATCSATGHSTPSPSMRRWTMLACSKNASNGRRWRHDSAAHVHQLARTPIRKLRRPQACERAGYVSQRDLLLAFDRYVGTYAPEPPLLRETLLQYLASLDRLTPRGLNNVVSVVWPAVTYALRHGACVEMLPTRPPKPEAYWRQRQPRILSATEVRSILAAARRLPPVDSLRPATTATLLGLLYTTGMRIGEALALDVGDLDCGDRI